MFVVGQKKTERERSGKEDRRCRCQRELEYAEVLLR